MNKVFTILAFSMGLVVLASNYLVQFSVQYFNLSELLIRDGVKNYTEIIGNKTIS